MKVLGLVAGVSAIAMMTWGLHPVKAQDNAASVEFYTTKVVPIMQANCYSCHGGVNHKGRLTLDTKEGMMKGGHDGAVIVPGDPAKSLLVKLIRHEGPADDPMPMPMNKPKLSDADIATVEQWVKAGAVMPEDTPKP
jgi:mono/diheme cytochrome c family protein